ncbi:hypothetical protein [Singulisphaera acidiphila]|uniref:Uncharacterized protein n=1 Tax=Singulisphaera acidiphila (strain ATCC BAA-1392 / DSM 18658 / VKM B-2454 / MOB10) TaxID=886293 RepID=L0DF64_SINAD|nr:hypothetical protein [Singulisphaera acidiphila]AGA27887.1 hypothetical protein Sinac_3639 [Singulisphaera acidiphila DSM 18658]
MPVEIRNFLSDATGFVLGTRVTQQAKALTKAVFTKQANDELTEMQDYE